MDFEFTGIQDSGPAKASSPSSCALQCRSPAKKLRHSLGESPSKKGRVSSPVPPRSPLSRISSGSALLSCANIGELSPKQQSPIHAPSSASKKIRPPLRRTKAIHSLQSDHGPQLRAALSSLSDNGNSSQSSSGDNGEGQENITPDESSTEFVFTTTSNDEPNLGKFSAPHSRPFASGFESFSPASLLQKDKPVKSSPLKRSDGFTGLDASGSGSPAFKRRSLYGAVSTPLAASTQIRRHPSPSDSDISVGTDEDSPPRRAGLPSPLASKSSGDMHRNLSLRPSPRPAAHLNRRSAEYERKIQRPSATPITRTSLDSTSLRSTTELEHNEPVSAFKMPAFPPSTRQTRHPLAQAQTPSSPNMFDPSEEFLPPPHMKFTSESFESSRRRPKHPFAKSLPVGAVRSKGPSNQSDDPNLDDISFDTPKESKFVPLRERSFQSTGFFAKKHRDVDDLPPPPEMPDTPCKKSAYEIMAETSPNAHDSFLQGRIAQPQFTGFEDMPGQMPTPAKHSLFNPLRHNQLGIAREGSSISNTSEEDSGSRQGGSQSGTDDGPDTPTKHMVSKNGKKENSLRRSSFLYRRASLGPNTFEPPTSEDSTPRANPDDAHLPLLLTSELPITPIDPLPDASGLSISPRSPNTPTFFRHDTQGSQRSSTSGMTPATPTGPQPQTFPAYNANLLMTPSNHGPAHDLDIELVARFSRVELLRKGKFSAVFKAYETRYSPNSHSPSKRSSFSSSCPTPVPEKVYAVKKLGPHRSASDHAKKLREAHIMERMGHCDNVISMLRYWESRNHLHLYIQTEFCEEGDLASWLIRHSFRGRLDDFRIWKVLIELSHGLRHIHACGFLHLDIKPENVFVHFDGTLKIGDFGHASEWPANGVEEEGDRRYMDEDVMHGRYDKPNDVFSLGSVIFEIASNAGLPDNGPRWRQLRSSDWSSLQSLTSGSTESFYSAAGAMDGKRSNASYGIPSDSSGSDHMQTDQEYDIGRYDGQSEPPPFMSDPSDIGSLDQVVHRMMWPNSAQRPTIDEVLDFYGCQWVQARKRHGAMIYEGVFGPTDCYMENEEVDIMEDIAMGEMV